MMREHKHFGRRVRQKISALLGATVLLTALPAMPTQAASDCVIDASVTYQSIAGFGGINLPEWITQGDMTDAQVQKAFGNGDDELGFTILRIYCSDDSNAWSRAMPTAKRAQALGATIFATPWNPPAAIRNTVNGGNSGGKYQLKSDKWAEYAQHLNSFVKYCEGQGINLYSISPQNEPDYAAEWTYWSANDLAKFIAQYGKAVTDGTKAKLMSPESFQYRKDLYNPILNNAQALANTDVWGTHFYGTQRSGMDFPALENSGKQIWMTEVYVPNSNADSANNWPQALEVAVNMHNGLVVGNLSAYVWWYIRRSYGPMTEDGKISKRGYMMAQYSKYVRPGAVRLGTTESPVSNLYCSSYKNEDGSIAIVAVNNTTNSITQNFVLSGGEQIKSLDSIRSSGSENLVKTEGLSHSDNSFSANLPAQSVTTFVIGASEPEPDPNGYFFHDTFESSAGSWSGRGSASAATTSSVSYDGSQSLAVTGRQATWNGATRALSSNVFKPGTAYSFSTDVMYNTGDDTETFHLTLQYTGSDGETHYDKIVEGVTVPKGEWVQLANTSYTIPAGASNMQMYVETEPNKIDFFVDEAIGAPEGMQIDGPGAPAVVTRKKGDVDGDGKINAKDLTLAKRIALGALTDASAKKAADVDGSGNVEVADLVWYVKYLTGEVKEFPESQTSTQEENYDTPGQLRSLADYVPIVQAAVDQHNKEPDSARAEVAGRQYGTVKSDSYYSTTCNRQKKFNILLPAGYDTSKKYPVVYIMHGYYENQDRMIIKGNGTMYTRQIIGNAIAEGEAVDMIAVFPDIYSSATQAACSGMDDNNNRAYDNFINDLTKDLMPYIEKNYSIKTGRENTAITGFSMGGRESLLIGTQRGDLFAYVGSICAAPGVNSFGWSDKSQEPSLLLMTAGTNDTVVYNGPVDYHNNATKAGVNHVWHYVDGGYHGDNSIHAHIYNFVRAIFKA